MDIIIKCLLVIGIAFSLFSFMYAVFRLPIIRQFRKINVLYLTIGFLSFGFLFFDKLIIETYWLTGIVFFILSALALFDVNVKDVFKYSAVSIITLNMLSDSVECFMILYTDFSTLKCTCIYIPVFIIFIWLFYLVMKKKYVKVLLHLKEKNGFLLL